MTPPGFPAVRINEWERVSWRSTLTFGAKLGSACRLRERAKTPSSKNGTRI